MDRRSRPDHPGPAVEGTGLINTGVIGLQNRRFQVRVLGNTRTSTRPCKPNAGKRSSDALGWAQSQRGCVANLPFFFGRKAFGTPPGCVDCLLASAFTRPAPG